MGIMEILVKGDALVIFFAQVWQFRDPSTECGCPHDRVGERGRAPGNGRTLQIAPEPSGGTTCWALHRSNNLAACPTRAITTQTCLR